MQACCRVARACISAFAFHLHAESLPCHVRAYRLRALSCLPYLKKMYAMDITTSDFDDEVVEENILHNCKANGVVPMQHIRRKSLEFNKNHSYIFGFAYIFIRFDVERILL